MTTRIACTALTGRIVSGRVNKEGNAFTGQKKDVTSDVLKAVIDKAAFYGGSFEVEGGNEKWLVTVTRATPAEQVQDDMKRFMDSLTHELIDMPDADVLDGLNPEAVKKHGLDLLEKAKAAVLDKLALDAFNNHFFKCTPSCSVESWTAAWKNGYRAARAKE